MKQRRAYHSIIVLIGFALLLFSAQWFIYLAVQVQQARNMGDVHLLVKEKVQPQFDEVRSQLPYHEWTFLTLEEWKEQFSKLWASSTESVTDPVALFSEHSVGVWVGRQLQLGFLDVAFGSLKQERLSMQRHLLEKDSNIVAVLGYPRWSMEFSAWLVTWTVLAFLLMILASSLLISSVVADVAFTLSQKRDELQILRWIGATWSQVRYPLMKQFMLRALMMTSGAIMLNGAIFIAFIRWKDVQMTLEWAHLFSVASVSAVVLGMILMWAAGRIVFRRTVSEWVGA